MSYLLDKKIKRKKFFYLTLGVVFLISLFYFRAGIFYGLSSVSQVIFHPVLTLGQALGEKFQKAGSYFLSKNSLFLENQTLRSELNEKDIQIVDYNFILEENKSLKEILGRKNEKATMVLTAILAKPNQSIYDTLIIDAGTKQGIKIGETVFALGNLPIGRIGEVYPNSSKVILFSNPGEKTEAVVSGKNVFMEVIGRGGGNFEMILPRDFILQKGDQVALPGIHADVLARVETIISDPRDPFIKALLTSPVNVQELKFVQVEIK
jgi:cell shape-determining protein MreC